MEEEDAILQQDTNAALQLFQALQHLVNASLDTRLQNMPEQILQLSNQVYQIETKHQQLFYTLDSVNRQLKNLASVTTLLENARQTNLLLGKQHYDEHIIKPVVRSLFPVFDHIEDARRHWSHSSQTTELLGAISSQLEQFLATYDVHVIQHQADNKFDPKIMKPIKLIPTEDGQLNDHIAESLKVGFRLGTERMLRLEMVTLFKHQPSQTNTINPNERAEKC